MKNYNYYYRVLSEVNLQNTPLTIYNQVLEELEKYAHVEVLIRDLLSSNNFNINMNLIYLFKHRLNTHRRYFTNEQLNIFLDSDNIEIVDTTLQYINTLDKETINELLSKKIFDWEYLNEYKNYIIND